MSSTLTRSARIALRLARRRPALPAPATAGLQQWHAAAPAVSSLSPAAVASHSMHATRSFSSAAMHTSALHQTIVPPWPVKTPAAAAADEANSAAKAADAKAASVQSAASATSNAAPASADINPALGASDGSTGKSAAVPSSAPSAAVTAIPSLIRRSTPPMDTYQFVYRLRQNGFTEEQAVAVMETLCRVSVDAQEASHSQLQSTYRADHSQLQSTYRAELSSMKLAVENNHAKLERSVEQKFTEIDRVTNEKIFNAALKTDVQIKHWREGSAKDLAHELASVRAELAQQRTQAEAERVAMRKEMENERIAMRKDNDTDKAITLADVERKGSDTENKLMRLLVTFVVSVSAIGLGAVRLLKG